LERRIDRTKKYQVELDIYERIMKTFEEGKPVRSMSFSEEEKKIVDQLFLLTSKPVLYAAKKLVNYAKNEGSEVMVICAKIEEEIAQLDDEEKAEFLKELGLSESGLDRLIKASYRLLGLISFLTAGPQEVRAWTIVKGTKAPQAAGKIHSDFEKGFIRAEVVAL